MKKNEGLPGGGSRWGGGEVLALGFENPRRLPRDRWAGRGITGWCSVFQPPVPVIVIPGHRGAASARASLCAPPDAVARLPDAPAHVPLPSRARAHTALVTLAHCSFLFLPA